MIARARALTKARAQAEDIFNIVQLSWILPDAAQGGSRTAAAQQAQVPSQGPVKSAAQSKCAQSRCALLLRLIESKCALLLRLIQSKCALLLRLIESRCALLLRLIESKCALLLRLIESKRAMTWAKGPCEKSLLRA